MSELKVTNLSHPSSGSANITLGSDGSVVLPQGFTGGIGSNVVQVVKTDFYSTSSSTYTTPTGLSASITLASASSKVLVFYAVPFGNDTNAIGAGGHLAIFRGSTNLIVPTGHGSRTESVSDITLAGLTRADRQTRLVSGVLLDSPGTTTPAAYSVRVRSGSGVITVNRGENTTDTASIGQGVSTLVLVEVAA